MNSRNTPQESNLLLRMVQRFFVRMVKPQDEFPVKYYKRTRHGLKGRHIHLSS